MNKKRLLILASGALIALLLTGLIGATAVFADEPTPEPEVPFGWRGVGRVCGGVVGIPERERAADEGEGDIDDQDRTPLEALQGCATGRGIGGQG